MSELMIYTPEKRAGQALSLLLKRRLLAPLYSSNLDDLLDSVRFGRANVIVLDLSSTPEIDCALEEVLDMAEGTSIIMVTPYATNEDVLERFHQRGYHILEKPICLDQLVALIQKLSTTPSQDNAVQ